MFSSQAPKPFANCQSMPDNQPPLSVASRVSVESSAPSRRTLSLGAERSTAEGRAIPPRAVTDTTVAQSAASSAAAVHTVPLKRLTAGRKALKIAHAGETYLLRITKANKLILTKPATDEKPPADSKV